MSDLFDTVAGAEGDMRRVYDHALILHDHLTSAKRMTFEEQIALSWLSADLLSAGTALRKHSDALYSAAKTPRPETRQLVVDEEPIFAPADLAMSDLFALFDVLGTLFDVLSGLEQQPRFASKVKLSPAGEMLEKLCEFIAGTRDDIRREAIGRTATTDRDRELKFFFLAEQWVDGSASPEHAIKGLNEVAAKIGGAQ